MQAHDGDRLMRFVIVLLALVMFGAGNSHAVSNEALYHDCKVFSEKGLQLDGTSAALCVGYFSAVNDFGRQICNDIRAMPIDPELSLAKSLLRFFSVEDEQAGNFKTAISSYLVKIENEPETLTNTPTLAVLSSLRELYPCK